MSGDYRDPTTTMTAVAVIGIVATATAGMFVHDGPTALVDVVVCVAALVADFVAYRLLRRQWTQGSEDRR